MPRHAWSLLVLLAGGLALPAAAHAQGTPPAQQQTERRTPVELVFEREVFAYPSVQRRNPFRPLSGASQGGPRFQDLRVVGIIFSANRSESVAVLGTSTVTYSEDASTVTIQPGQSWYLKVGQSVGNVRVVEIHRDQVVVEVEEFGLTEQRIMRLQTRRVGGTP